MVKVDGQRLIAHLNLKWQGRTCPVCNGGPWTAQDTLFELRQFNEGSMVIGGPLIPVIPISCGNCGNTVLINEIAAGLYKPETGEVSGNE